MTDDKQQRTLGL